MGFLSQIKDIFARPQRPPAVPPGFQPFIPIEDPEEIIEPPIERRVEAPSVPDIPVQQSDVQALQVESTKSSEGEDFYDDPLEAFEPGTTIGIQYVDAKNEESRRVITIRKIVAKPDGLVFQCYCHTRKAPRAFRADRVTAIIDIVTGEVFDDPVGYFQEFSPSLAALVRQSKGLAVSDKVHKRAMGLCRDGVRVLMYLANADGVVVDDELEVVARYIDECCQPMVPDYDLDRILEYARRQYPDAGTVGACMRRLLDREEMDRVLDYCKEIIEADKVWTVEEVKAADVMREIFSEIADSLEQSR